MKRKLYSIALALTGLLLLGACSENDNEFPWDHSDEGTTLLEAFGPEVQRLGDMTIIGKNLQNVKQVVFPVDVVVEDFTRVSNEKIVVKVPYEAEAGKLTLVLEDGQTIVSTADIIYVDVFTVPTVQMGEGKSNVRAGDTISLTGDYLYNVATITFMSGVEVAIDDESVAEVTRHSITLTVPQTAQTGQVKIADANGINVYSENELVVRQPVIQEISPLKIKAGETLKIKGQDVDLIEGVTFTGGVAAGEVKVVSDKEIQVTVPATATNGTVTGTSFAGIATTSEESIELVLPTELAVSAELFKAGETLKIAGKDLDLVTGVSFTSAEATFTYDGEVSEIYAEIPATATDGALTLTVANGSTVTTEAITLAKAEITAVAPTDLMAGEQVTLTGNHLDLVTGVQINGIDHDFTLSGEQIIITTTTTSQSGVVTLKQANGVKVESPETITFSYDSLISITSLSESAAIGDQITMEGSSFSLIENIFIGGVKVTAYAERTDTRMVFAVPEGVDTGSYTLEFLLFTGDTEFTAQSVEIRGATATISMFEGEFIIDYSWANSWQDYTPSNYSKLPLKGTKLNVEYTLSTENNYWQIKVQDATWTVLPTFPGNEWGVVALDEGSTLYTFELTEADVRALAASGMVISGCGINISKIYFTYENLSTDPIFVSDLLLVDYEQHGDHNGSWDGSWSGCTTMYTENGNNYVEVSADQSGEVWIVNCNHQANFNADYVWTIDDASKYCVKFDVCIDESKSSLSAADAAMQIVLSDNWFWVGPGLLPATTDGKWITITRKLSDIGCSLTDYSAGTHGLYGGPIPAGVKFDNLRLSLID